MDRDWLDWIGLVMDSIPFPQKKQQLVGFYRQLELVSFFDRGTMSICGTAGGDTSIGDIIDITDRTNRFDRRSR